MPSVLSSGICKRPAKNPPTRPGKNGRNLRHRRHGLLPACRTSAHACPYPLTGHLSIPHGKPCGLTIDHFTYIDATADTDGRPNELARATSFPDPGNMADAIAEPKYRTGLKTGLTDTDLHHLISASHLPNRPLPITETMLCNPYASLR